MNPVRTAFKEWAVVVDALASGQQILILRKGGISEGRGGFQVDHENFWFFPTLYHQQGESVIPSAAARYDVLKPELADATRVRIHHCARVVEWKQLDSLALAERLRGQHIWKDEVISQRFDWGKEQNIFALAVRVSRLPKPIDLPVVASYGGCKSWIDLEMDIPVEDARPVLGDAEFALSLELFRNSVAVVPAG